MPNSKMQHNVRQDNNGVNIAGWEGASDVIVEKQEQLISNTFTSSTNASGSVSVPVTPISALTRILDYKGNLTYNYGISVADAGNSTPYYYGNVDPTAGTFQVFSDAGLTTPVANTSVKVTYFYLAPVGAILGPNGRAIPLVTPNNAMSVTPVVGQQNVGTTATEIFAGTQRLANRYEMTIYSETNLIYWGSNPNVTTANGFPIPPGGSKTWKFRPDIVTPIYLVGGQACSVRVEEFA